MSRQIGKSTHVWKGWLHQVAFLRLAPSHPNANSCVGMERCSVDVRTVRSGVLVRCKPRWVERWNSRNSPRIQVLKLMKRLPFKLAVSQFLPARSEAARGKASGTQAASRPNVKSGRSSRSGTCCPQRFVSHLWTTEIHRNRGQCQRQRTLAKRLAAVWWVPFEWHFLILFGGYPLVN